jgi:RNA polymerase sigma-70 factor (ECF subfamily)
MARPASKPSAPAANGGPAADPAADLIARDPDVRLMLQVKEDVQGAFDVLVERYQDRVLAVTMHLIGGKAPEAEDLTQEVFLRIYKARKGYKPRAKFATWLFTIVNNLASNHLRSHGRNPTVPLISGGESGPVPAQAVAEHVPGREGTPSAQMRQLELSQIVQEAVNTLGEDQKLAVLLNKFEEMSYAEIAEVMGKSEAAVKSLLARARMNLRDQLEPYLRAEPRGA